MVSLDYLAPEHAYPAALLDTCDALRWLADHGAGIGGDGRVAAGGQSAGAALVAGACLLARDHDLPSAAYQVLCYPVLDSARTPSPPGCSTGCFTASNPAGRRTGTSAASPSPSMRRHCGPRVSLVFRLPC